jgi:hypothetical protein
VIVRLPSFAVRSTEDYNEPTAYYLYGSFSSKLTNALACPSIFVTILIGSLVYPSLAFASFTDASARKSTMT